MKAVRPLEAGDRSARDERMEREVLSLLCHGSGGTPGRILRIAEFVQQLGPWREEVFRVLARLDRQGYVVFLGAGPTISITAAGVARADEVSARRSVRGDPSRNRPPRPAVLSG